MRLDEVLPELMGSLALSELLFRGEGPPRACRRMDQYQRKMRKPVGGKGVQGSEAGGSPPNTTPFHFDPCLPTPPTQAPHTDSIPGVPTTPGAGHRSRRWTPLYVSPHFILSRSLETRPRYYHSVLQTGRPRPRGDKGLG